jgi:NAD(P)-dependent dehydrogenase (short-subunit alcohol dehydrogenase family)
MTQSELAGQRALVTGGTRGIGRAIVIAMRAAGATVLALARTEGPDAVGDQDVIRADVRDDLQMATARQEVEDRVGSLDILVVNAGMNIRKPFLELSSTEVSAVLETNLGGALTTIRHFGPMLHAGTDGRLVIMSSLSAQHGMVDRAPYNATKGALASLARSLAVEWGPLGIRVNAVAPGLIRTPLTEQYMADHPDKVAAGIAHTPLARLGDPSDVADVVMFLVSSRSRFVTGQVIHVDGGLSAGSAWW